MRATVRRAVEERKAALGLSPAAPLPGDVASDVAASFQEAVIDVLATRHLGRDERSAEQVAVGARKLVHCLRSGTSVQHDSNGNPQRERTPARQQAQELGDRSALDPRPVGGALVLGGDRLAVHGSSGLARG